MRRMGWIIIAVLLLISSAVHAQNGGQFCVRAFDDTNANGKIDAGEVLLTRGINVNLLNAQNVTIASALLDESPTAAQGVVCFQFLAPGQYTIDISSADYTATTPASITTTIEEGGLPTVVEFGGQPVAAMVGTPAVTDNSALLSTDDSQLVRILIATAGTLIVIIGMGILGVIVYLLVFGRRPKPVSDLRRTTGSIRAVDMSDTGKVKPVTAGDTGKIKKV